MILAKDVLVRIRPGLIVTFGVLLTVAIYAVGGLAALLQHLTMRRIQ